VLTDHFGPPPFEITGFHHFYKSDQKTGESLNNYLAALRIFARDYNFVAALDRMMRVSCVE